MAMAAVAVFGYGVCIILLALYLIQGAYSVIMRVNECVSNFLSCINHDL